MGVERRKYVTLMAKPLRVNVAEVVFAFVISCFCLIFCRQYVVVFMFYLRCVKLKVYRMRGVY